MPISIRRFGGPLRLLLGTVMAFVSALWAGSKGPDAGQYTATDAAVYSFIDIAGAGGSASVLADTDDGAVLLTLPFQLQFYDHAYGTVCVGSNGLLTFVSEAAACGSAVDFANADLSAAGPPGDIPAILPLWSDLTFQAPGAGAVFYQTFGSPGSRRFIVQWNNAYPQGSPNPVTFQVILSEGSNQILFQYKTVDLGSGNAASNGALASIGIRDAGGNASNRQIAWSYNAGVLANETALLFSGPASSGGPLLSVSQTADAGSVAAGTPIGFTVHVSNSSAAGTGAATGATLTDDLPAGGLDWTISPAYSGTGTCSITGAVGSQTLSCTFGDLAAGASASVHVSSGTSASSCSDFTNTATVSASNGSSAQGSATTTVLCPVLTIDKTHTGNFVRGQTGATYTVTVSNRVGAVATSGTVTVSESVPAGLSLASMAGTDWTCPSAGNTCTRTDPLAGGASYSPITVTVNVAPDAISPQVNAVGVSVGGSANVGATDSTTIVAAPNTITAGSTSAATGGAFSIPITLTLSSGVSIDKLTFGVKLTPMGSAPALTGALAFTKNASIADAPFVSTGGTSNEIGVAWASLGSPLGGVRVLGVISGTIPSGAIGGHCYTVTFTGASGATAAGSVPVVIGRGPDVTVDVGMSYSVGDVAPYTSDTAPGFGDASMNILDLVQVLFAANNVPGFVPAPCSDRYDAMDLYPVDAGAARGGDGALDVRDLIRELFRVNNLDLDRPVRSSLGGVCAGSARQTAAIPAEPSRNAETLLSSRAGVQGALVLGVPENSSEGEERIPVYLEAGRGLIRVAVTFALGDRRSQLRFLPTAETPPSLVQDSQLGVVAAAWLGGLSVRAGERLLLGHVAGPPGALANLKLYGASASGLDDNRKVRLDAPAAVGTRR